MIEVNHSGNREAAPFEEARRDDHGSPQKFRALSLQPEFHLPEQDRYHINDLLRYHDHHFVSNAYVAILKRRAEEAELVRELDALRNGQRSKTEIIENLLASTEGVSRGVQIEGLPSPAMRRLGHWPIVGYAIRLLKGLARLPVLMQHQQQFEIYTLAQQQQIVDYLNTTFADIGDSLLNLQSLNESALATLQEDFKRTLLGFQKDFAEDLRKARETYDQEIHKLQLSLTDNAEMIVVLSDALAAASAQVEAQREFLIQEERVIVETQKVVLANMEEHLRKILAQHQQTIDGLASQVQRMRALFETKTTHAPDRENA